MPGGELPVPGGDAVVAPINRLLAQAFDHAFATQDWHPPGHVSFASTHGAAAFASITLPYGEQTLWPDHGLIGSSAAALHPDLDLSRVEAIFRKGFRPTIDSYSAFRENDRKTGTGLDGWLKERGFKRLFLCGLATDYCVFLVGPGRSSARVRGVRHRGRVSWDRGAHQRGLPERGAWQ